MICATHSTEHREACHSYISAALLIFIYFTLYYIRCSLVAKTIHIPKRTVHDLCVYRVV